jgi:hypothetical protein
LLGDVENRAKRAAFIDWLASGGLPDLAGLADKQIRIEAWGSHPGVIAETSATSLDRGRAR